MVKKIKINRFCNINTYLTEKYPEFHDLITNTCTGSIFSTRGTKAGITVIIPSAKMWTKLEAINKKGDSTEMRKYIPDFIVQIDDGKGDDDLLHLIVEIKGYRREDAKEKKSTMETYWVPGVNNLGNYGRWAFAEFTEVYQIESDFEAKVESEFNKMIQAATSKSEA